MGCCQTCYKGSFALLIWIELICGLVASTGVAFVDSGKSTGITWRLILLYIIFVADLAFASWLFYYTGKETCCNNTGGFTLNWLSGMVTVVSAALFGALIYLAGLNAVLTGALLTFILAVLVLYGVASCYMIFLRMGCYEENPEPTRRPLPKPISGTSSEPSKEGKTLEESLTQIVDHVQNNPTRKGFTMYAPGSETPFTVVVNQ